MYDKCYFCLDQLPKLKKESTASFFVNFGRSRGTKEPTYITVINAMAHIPAMAHAMAHIQLLKELLPLKTRRISMNCRGHGRTSIETLTVETLLFSNKRQITWCHMWPPGFWIASCDPQLLRWAPASYGHCRTQIRQFSIYNHPWECWETWQTSSDHPRISRHSCSQEAQSGYKSNHGSTIFQ